MAGERKLEILNLIDGKDKTCTTLGFQVIMLQSFYYYFYYYYFGIATNSGVLACAMLRSSATSDMRAYVRGCLNLHPNTNCTAM